MNTDNKNSNSQTGEIIDFKSFKAKKLIKENLSKDRYPLYLSYLDKKSFLNTKMQSANDERDFSERLKRIKASLERINKLMSELKKIAEKEESEIPSNIKPLSRNKD